MPTRSSAVPLQQKLPNRFQLLDLASETDDAIHSSNPFPGSDSPTTIEKGLHASGSRSSLATKPSLHGHELLEDFVSGL
jgi:hypothetical protein